MTRIKPAVRRLTYRLMQTTGYLAARRHLAVGRGDGWATVLVFHSVDPDAPEDGLNIHPSRFADICGTLRRSYDVLPLDRLVQAMGEARPLTGREVIITFDDGYRNNHEYAMPILRAHDLPATFYLTAGYIESDHRFWWDQDRGIDLPMMTWAEARDMAEAGFDIGCHTWSHPDLGTLPTGQANLEVHQARTVLQERTGARVRHFAFPYGRAENITPEWVDVVKTAGFSSLVSAVDTWVTNQSDPFMIPRLGASPQRSIEALRIDIDRAW